MKSIVIAAVALTVIGCGNGSGLAGGKQEESVPENSEPISKNPEEETVTPRSLYVVNAAALPTCDEGAEGWLVYVKSEAAFKACQGGSWAVVEVGEPNRIEASISCAGDLENTSLWFTYSASLMTSGDVFVVGSINDDYSQASQAKFYSSQQVGAVTAAILITNDQLGAATGGFFTLELNRDTLVTRITYKDAETSDLTWTMQPSDCVANEY